MVVRLRRLTFPAFCRNKLDLIFAPSENEAPTKRGALGILPYKSDSGFDIGFWKASSSVLSHVVEDLHI